MIAIRSGMGLGDSLYLQAVVRHLALRGHMVEACSAWPDVFRPLRKKGVTVSPFRRDRIDRLAHYALRKHEPTDQFVDCCLQAGIGEPVDLRLDWTAADAGLIATVKASGKPVVLVAMPREPMDRKDGYGRDLLPERRAVQAAIAALRAAGAVTVQVGKGAPLYRLDGIDIDYAGATSVCDLIDLASACDAMLGYVSFFVPLAESLDKPALFVWSRRGTQSKTDYIRLITPAKILHKRSSRAVFDDEPEAIIADAARALLA